MLNSPTGHCLDFKSMETCCALSLSPIPPHPRLPPPKNPRQDAPGNVLTLRGNRWMEPHFPICAVGLHWGSDLNHWASKARKKQGTEEPGRFAHTPPERSLPGTPALACTETAFSHSVETPLGRTAQLLISEARFALNSFAGPLRDLKSLPFAFLLHWSSNSLRVVCCGGGGWGCFFVLVLLRFVC